MNTIELSGNLVEDIKTEKNKGGKTVVKNKIAVTDGKGTKFEETYFIPITIHGKDLIKSLEPLTKRDKKPLVKVQGKLVCKSFKNDKGDWVNYTNVVVFKLEEIKFDKNNKCLNPGGFDKPYELNPIGFQAIEDDDLPF